MLFYRVSCKGIWDGEWDVYFGPLRLGRFHERTLLIEDALGRQYRRPYYHCHPCLET